MERLIAHLWLMLGVVLFTVAVAINENSSLGIIGMKTLVIGVISLFCFLTGIIKYNQLRKVNR